MTFRPSLNVPTGTSTPARCAATPRRSARLSRRGSPVASSSIRQPEDVLVSVASPWRPAPGRSVQAQPGTARREVPEPNTASPIATASHSGRDGARRPGRAGARPARARTSLRFDARSQARRRLDLGRGAPRERDRTLLLGKPVGELRRRRDSCLERGTTLRRERPVRERRQLGDLLAAGFLFLTAFQHGNGNGSSESGERA